MIVPSLFSRMPVRPGTRFKSTMYLAAALFFHGDDQVGPASEKAAARAVFLTSRLASFERSRLVEFEWLCAFHEK